RLRLRGRLDAQGPGPGAGRSPDQRRPPGDNRPGRPVLRRGPGDGGAPLGYVQPGGAADQAMTAPGFLSPYKVLDLTDQRGLLAGRMLGQLGADVVQVEPPAGSSARRVGPFTEDAPPDNSLHWSAFASAKRG